MLSSVRRWTLSALSTDGNPEPQKVSGLKIYGVSRAWWHTPRIPTRRRVRVEDLEFLVNSGFTERPCIKTPEQNKTQQKQDHRMDWDVRENVI